MIFSVAGRTALGIFLDLGVTVPSPCDCDQRGKRAEAALFLGDRPLGTARLRIHWCPSPRTGWHHLSIRKFLSNARLIGVYRFAQIFGFDFSASIRFEASALVRIWRVALLRKCFEI